MSAGSDKPLDDQVVDILFAEQAFEDNPLTEQILVERLGKGRSQIRDALNRLEAEELIERRKKKGVYVTKPTPKVIAELYDLRMLLEGYAARQAVRTARDADLQQLQDIATAFDEATERRDFQALEIANTEFHYGIIRLSQNELLIRMMGRMNIIRKAFKYAYELEPERQRIGSPYAHNKIIESLRARDADAAESLMRNHIQVGKERVLEQALGFRIKNV
jgi:DNA-binding GntR family transcriptional regulator